MKHKKEKTTHREMPSSQSFISSLKKKSEIVKTSFHNFRAHLGIICICAVLFCLKLLLLLRV